MRECQGYMSILWSQGEAVLNKEFGSPLPGGGVGRRLSHLSAILGEQVSFSALWIVSLDLTILLGKNFYSAF